MNYLSHFTFNHELCRLDLEPYFVLGVALPDLWMRFSRKRRLRWRAVRAAEPDAAAARGLQAGLLNHVEVDRRFHTTTTFVRWQREVKAGVSTDGVHPALADFLVHAGIELVMDHHLMHEDARLVDRFYDEIASADALAAAELAGQLGAVDTTGLAEVIETFAQRRYLRRYMTLEGVCEALGLVLSLAEIDLPPRRFIADVVDAAADRVRPRIVLAELVP